MKLFAKKSSKKQGQDDDDNHQESSYFPSSEASSPTKSPTKPRSPIKSPTKSPTKKPSQPASPGPREIKPSRTSRTFGRHPTDPGSRRSSKIDLDSHPLNLPPEERAKRLSALSAMSGNAMDIDRESSAAPSSPPAAAAAAAASPQPSAQTSFSVPKPNGINTNINGNGDAPAPPPHKSNPSSPVPTTEDEAEAYKAAGNKFFKEKDYKNAILQYSKGKCCRLQICIGYKLTSLLQPSSWSPIRLPI